MVSPEFAGIPQRMLLDPSPPVCFPVWNRAIGLSGGGFLQIPLILRGHYRDPMGKTVMYSDRDFELAKPIINRIRRFPALEIVLDCMRHIWTAEQRRPASYDHYPPWILLLLVKWTLIYGDPLGSIQPSRYDIRAFRTLFGELSELWRKLDRERADERITAESWFTYFRKKSFQQFPFRDTIYLTRLARQNLMFGNLDQQDPLSLEFLKRIGVSIEDFSLLQFLLVACISSLNKPQIITEELFRTVTRGYPQGTMSRFLQALSQDLEGIRAYFMSQYAQHPPELRYEYTEMPPLKRYRLLRTGSGCLCYSPILLSRALEDFIYDTLKSYDRQSFGNHFGSNIFEPYVGQALSHSQLPVIRESEILREIRNVKICYY